MDAIDLLQPMFNFVRTRLQEGSHVSDAQEGRMSELLDDWDLDGRGIPITRLGEVFARIAALPDLSCTLTDSEVFALTAHVGHAADPDQEILISKTDLLRAWRAALERVLLARRDVLRSLISGAFVSTVFQKVGILPEGEAFFFTPMDFADSLGDGSAGVATGAFLAATLGPEARVSFPD